MLESDPETDSDSDSGAPDDDPGVDSLDVLLVGGTAKTHPYKVADALTFQHAHAIAWMHRCIASDYRPALRDYLRTALGADPVDPAEHAGAFVYQGLNHDLRVALASRDGLYRYNRIYISHDIDVFLLTAYRLTWATLATGGKFFVFRLPRDAMLRIAHTHSRDRSGVASLCVREGDPAWRELLPFSIKLL